ncbi:hypothetical protein IL306_004065 [Fusarium sp. DS 682]|nr:hypothetical protein IL306_004065 [Fusarium sp. DS 682]
MSRCCCWQYLPDGAAELDLLETAAVVLGERLADTGPVALAGIELPGHVGLSAELDVSVVGFVGKQAEPVAQDDKTEASVVERVAAVDCEEDTRLAAADAAAEEQAYAAAKYFDLVL